MAPKVQDIQGKKRLLDGSDSDNGSWSSSDALTADVLAMTSQSAGRGAEEEEGPAQKQIHVPDKRGFRKLLAYLGPGFLVAIAYIDPGNFESDLKAGADFKYELLWVLLLASIAGLIIQSLAANLGVVTGKHLSEHCRAEYPKRVNHALWIIAELAIVASDIPEVIGTAFALQMLFGIPLWIGVILTGFSTLILLALQNYGVRKLEIFISVLVFMIASCFFFELYFARPRAAEVLEGMFVPRLNGSHATAIAVSLLGAVVMPHNLYLHSALVLTRKVPRTARGIKDGCRFNFIECSFALFLAFAINVSVIAVAGAVCSRPNLSPSDLDNCQNIDLDRTPFLLQNVLGKWSRELFAVALLASGQSSTITGTYAGQYVMQGFLELRFKPWLRNLLTRAVAIVPSLAVAMIGGSSGAGDLIIISSMILSFELPFALLPLLKFTSSPVKMGPFTNHWVITLATWLIGFFVIGVNCYFLGSLGIDYLRESNLPTGVVVLVAIVMFASMFVYLVCLLYLALRKDSEVTYVHPDSEQGGDILLPRSSVDDLTGDQFGPMPREDIAHMQLGSPKAREGLLSEAASSEVAPLDREDYTRRHGGVDQDGPD